MARLRTVMARSRTGMAFIRTGMSISSVGIGLLVYFGAGSLAWTVFDVLMIISGFAIIADGLYWHIPANNKRKQFPYCFADMEITVPDYGKPVWQWKKAVFSHDGINSGGLRCVHNIGHAFLLGESQCARVPNCRRALAP